MSLHHPEAPTYVDTSVRRGVFPLDVSCLFRRVLLLRNNRLIDVGHGDLRSGELALALLLAGHAALGLAVEDLLPEKKVFKVRVR